MEKYLFPLFCLSKKTKIRLPKVHDALVLFLFCIFVCFIRPAIFSHLGVEYDYVALVYHRAVTEIYASIPALKRRHKIGHLIVILGIKITHSLSRELLQGR